MWTGGDKKPVVLVVVLVVVVVVVQAFVLGHCFGSGLVSASQLDVVHPTAPGVPDSPAPTPHFVAHPVGSVRIHVPKEWDALNNHGQKLRQRHA